MALRRRIIPLALKNVGPVDACRCNFDHDFARARLRHGNFAKLQNLRAPFALDDNGFHGLWKAHRQISQ